MGKIKGEARKFSSILRRAIARWAENDRGRQSKEPRSAYNFSIAGKRWNGLLFQPTIDANAAAWGFGFVPPTEVESLAVPLGRRCFGQKMRMKIWRCRGATAGDPFRTPGAKGDAVIFDEVFEAVPSVDGEPIAQFCRVDLSKVRQWERCLHKVELRFAEIPTSSLAVGQSTCEGPWSWESGWVELRGQAPAPIEQPLAIAWSAYGPEGQERGWCNAGAGMVEAAGCAEANGFKLSLPVFTVVQTSQTIRSTPVEFQVPEPEVRDRSAVMRAGVRRILLPYRHAELVAPPFGVCTRPVGGEVQRSGNVEGELCLKYRGWGCRYDMVSIDRDTGQLALTMGPERDLDPEEFPAALPRRHIPLYSVYTTKDGVEAIPVWEWHDMVRDSRRTDYIWWLESSRKSLRRTFRKLQCGGTIRLAGYGDSVTSLGGRDARMIDAENGPYRDTLGYFERYGKDWKASVEIPRAGPANIRHHKLGWNWHLKAAMESAYDIEVKYLNWGIPGTTSGGSCQKIDGNLYPNGSESKRLERLLSSRPDIVTIAFGMNDIGDQIDTYANIRKICDVITESGADVIVVGLCQQNPSFDSRDHSLWRLTHDHIAAAAHDSDVAYIPTWEIFGDGNEAATGLSRRSHSAASMTNHPGGRELASIGRYMASIFI
ncbi:MAG: SGNH/GDSL hydrolase family protein [Sphingomonas sp.]|nr:SGNH/GDSL hydrolase family protein [Sphingomonas sp.]